MRNFLSVSIILLIYISFTSCSHSYYVASPTNVPLLTHNGDAKINVDLLNAMRVFLPDAIGGNLSGSYAFSEKFGVMGSGSIMDKRSGFGDEVDKILVQNFEIGVGFINTRISENFLFEIFSGTGYVAQQFHNIEAPDLKIHSFKYFLQPNIALKKNNFFSLAFSPKLVWVKTDLNYHSFDSLNNELGGNTGVFYFEPTIDMRVGRLVKFRVQIKYVQALENPVPYFQYYPFNGLSGRIR